MATACDRVCRAKPLLGTFVEIAVAHTAPEVMAAAGRSIQERERLRIEEEVSALLDAYRQCLALVFGEYKQLTAIRKEAIGGIVTSPVGVFWGITKN